MRAERDMRERRCVGFEGAIESTHSLADPGTWEATAGANGVVGVRRVKQTVVGGSSGGLMGFGGSGRSLSPTTSAVATTTTTSSGTSSLVYRRPSRQGAADQQTQQCQYTPQQLQQQQQQQRQKHPLRHQSGRKHAQERWEAWTMTAGGFTSIHELEQTDLPANDPGPLCRLAQNAVAVALANVIVTVQFGRYLHDDDGSAGDGSNTPMVTHRRLSRQNSRLNSRAASIASPARYPGGAGIAAGGGIGGGFGGG